MKTLFLFGKDLRLQDSEALSFAADGATELLPGYIFEPGFDEQSPIRQHSLLESLRALHGLLPGGLEVGPESLPASLERLLAFGPERVIATRRYDPRGMLWQAEIAAELVSRGVRLELVGSNYAVTPGSIVKDDGSPLKVYTPFYKRWHAHHWPRPFTIDVQATPWRESARFELPEASGPSPIRIRAGEAQALKTWSRFRETRLADYSERRNRPDLGGTSHLSHALAHGEIHPRTLLAELGSHPSHEVFRKEIAWREFYADVLWHNPHTLTEYYQPQFAKMRYADPVKDAEALKAWQLGRTGYPIVDAAMRQLNETGWMHNRSRMIVASFLVKDLHFEWQHGATYFEQQLTDFDPASNSHGWQWTAGCGTDASPYYRVFNPILQGEKFDPNGDYVRRFIPELRHIQGASVHSPWLLVDGLAQGYPAPIVDHAAERDEALRRLDELKTL